MLTMKCKCGYGLRFPTTQGQTLEINITYCPACHVHAKGQLCQIWLEQTAKKIGKKPPGGFIGGEIWEGFEKGFKIIIEKGLKK